MANLMRTGWSYADAVRGPVRQHKSAGLTPIPTKDEAFPPLVQTSPPEQLPLPAATAAEPIALNGIHVVSICQCYMSIFRVNYNLLICENANTYILNYMTKTFVWSLL